MLRRAIVMVVGLFCWAVPAQGEINLEFRPANQVVSVGDPVNVGLYAVSDSDSDQPLLSVQVIFSWDVNFLQLLGLDQTGAVGLAGSFFPAGDPFGLNEEIPPQDGDGLYIAFAPPGSPVAATPAGTLLTTFQFLALDETAGTPVDILASGGDPAGQTVVSDSTGDVTGTLSGAIVEILVATPNPKLILTADPTSADAGETVVITLSMADLGANEANGFQAFLRFDSTRLTYVSGAYTALPFGQHFPIVINDEHIDLAAGVAPGNDPTSDDAELVHLTFETKVDGCVGSVSFRVGEPTLITDPDGQPIEPLTLIGLQEVDDGDACTLDECDPDTGEVTHTPLECDDGDLCTADSCDPVIGCTFVPVDCSGAGDQCNTASCDPDGADVNCDIVTPAADETPCDDGDACTESDQCTTGTCGGADVDCSGAGNQCNTASCDPDGSDGNCDTFTPVADETPCDDDDACTESDQCTTGTCGGADVDCSGAGNQCNTASCDPDGSDGNCDTFTPVADETPCDDGDACTESDQCTTGTCGGADVDCSGAGSQCTIASCDLDGEDGNCDNLGPAKKGTPCDDGSLCTDDDACVGGGCSGVPNYEPGIECCDPETGETTPVDADFDGNGVIGPFDLAFVLGFWGDCFEPPEECPADLDCDGVVGPADLAIVLSLWD